MDCLNLKSPTHEMTSNLSWVKIIFLNLNCSKNDVDRLAKTDNPTQKYLCLEKGIKPLNGIFQEEYYIVAVSGVQIVRERGEEQRYGMAGGEAKRGFLSLVILICTARFYSRRSTLSEHLGTLWCPTSLKNE